MTTNLFTFRPSNRTHNFHRAAALAVAPFEGAFDLGGTVDETKFGFRDVNRHN